MVVPLGLPQALVCALRKEISGLLFEKSDKAQDVGCWVHSFRQQMQVIWHDAIKRG
jgi:hypothetical protein